MRNTRLPVSERGHLNHDRQRLEHEDTADDHQEQLLLDEDGDRPERSAEGK
jgi:hypothetical protein